MGEGAERGGAGVRVAGGAPVPTPSEGLPGSGGTSLLGAALPAAGGGGCASLLVHPRPRDVCDSLDGRVPRPGGRGVEFAAARFQMRRRFVCGVG